MAKKKVEAIGLDVNQKRELVDKSDNVISIRNQCDLLNLNRSTFYQPAMKGESLENRNIMDMIDEIYTENPKQENTSCT